MPKDFLPLSTMMMNANYAEASQKNEITRMPFEVLKVISSQVNRLICPETRLAQELPT